MTPTAQHSAEKRFVYVESRAGVYRTQFELATDEPLGSESAIAVLCFDFADLVAQGKNVYLSINSLDNDWRMLVFSGELYFSESFENRIIRLYKVWLDVSKNVVQLDSGIERDFVSRGFETSTIATLQKAIREVEGVLTDDSEFFNHPKLVNLRDSAIDDLNAGSVDFVTDSIK